MSEENFWVNNEDVVVTTQRAIAVYENTVGCIVIRQDADGAYDDDQVVTIRPEYVEALIGKLQAVKSEIEAGGTPAKSGD